MISILIIAVVLLGTSSGLLCPECHEKCGLGGFMACEPCICNPTCTSDFCSGGRECILVEVHCYEKPCPKLPQCIDVNKTCDSAAMRASNGDLVVCSNDAHQCPEDYRCTVAKASLSICCRDDIKITPKPSDTEVEEPPWGFIPGLQLIPDPTEKDDENPLDKIDEDDLGNCQDCSLPDVCQFISCSNYPKAVCVTDDCTCTSYFIDENEEKVFCEIPPDEDKRDDDELDLTTSITANPEAVSSQNGSETSKVIIRQVLIASCVVFLFIVILLVTCKVIHWKRRSMFRKQQEEQLKPLRIGNNNKMDLA
uniref:Uncharacterized protein LOC100177650 n=1 Tax=Phallusia mammillata TaxID=59560 RepID=A0A6F9DG12_9ASCI|nr:uncharacterized protein LOC100177650 [Phallusia mammillata]